MWMKSLALLALGAAVVGGVTVLAGPESSERPTAPADQVVNGASKVALISEGEAVELVDHTDPGGKYTVFLFGADW